MDQTDNAKHPLQSLGVMAPLIAIIVIVLNHIHPGLGLTNADVAPMLDSIDAIVGALFAIVGRWKATQPVSLSAPLTRRALPASPPKAVDTSQPPQGGAK